MASEASKSSWRWRQCLSLLKPLKDSILSNVQNGVFANRRFWFEGLSESPTTRSQAAGAVSHVIGVSKTSRRVLKLRFHPFTHLA